MPGDILCFNYESRGADNLSTHSSGYGHQFFSRDRVPGRNCSAVSAAEILANQSGDIFRRSGQPIRRRREPLMRKGKPAYVEGGGPFYDFLELVLKPLAAIPTSQNTFIDWQSLDRDTEQLSLPIARSRTAMSTGWNRSKNAGCMRGMIFIAR